MQKIELISDNAIELDNDRLGQFAQSKTAMLLNIPQQFDRFTFIASSHTDNPETALHAWACRDHSLKLDCKLLRTQPITYTTSDKTDHRFVLLDISRKDIQAFENVVIQIESDAVQMMYLEFTDARQAHQIEPSFWGTCSH